MSPRRTLFALLMAIVASLSTVAPASASGYVNQAKNLDEVLTAIDYQEDDGNILRLYQAFFDRLPDTGGTVYWIEISRGTLNLDQIAEQFARSKEFNLSYGSVTDREFLEIVYQNVLGRGYDQGGFDYWLGKLEGGLSRGGVVRWVAASQEFTNSYPFHPAGPTNPGDTVNCGDFTYQQEAQAWFEYHFAAYGDIARLDQNNDGVACEALPRRR